MVRACKPTRARRTAAPASVTCHPPRRRMPDKGAPFVGAAPRGCARVSSSLPAFKRALRCAPRARPPRSAATGVAGTNSPTSRRLPAAAPRHLCCRGASEPSRMDSPPSKTVRALKVCRARQTAAPASVTCHAYHYCPMGNPTIPGTLFTKPSTQRGPPWLRSAVGAARGLP